MFGLHYTLIIKAVGVFLNTAVRILLWPNPLSNIQAVSLLIVTSHFICHIANKRTQFMYRVLIYDILSLRCQYNPSFQMLVSQDKTFY